MNRFYIITNSDKDKELLITGKIEKYLEERGCVLSVCQAEHRMDGTYHYTDPDKVPKDTQCVIVLGGDGTLLQAAGDLVHLDIPLIGINLGTMGFLAEVDRHSIYPSLDKLLCDQYEIEERMMLSGTVYRGRESIGQSIALNDIVITRDGNLRVISFKNFVNNEYLNSYDADGIIISTPTGSTGYSLSAGGPVVAPNAAMILMTPVAPHTMNARSIVLSPDDVVTIELGPGRHGTTEKGTAFFDGDTVVAMQTGDRIVIRRSEEKTRILKLNHLSFLEVLRQKMD
ncbi:MAG: NAD(+)/NADH kinase [Blautia sp.]|nr:NAD(+)/NADH kinase [Blautia sp.]